MQIFLIFNSSALNPHCNTLNFVLYWVSICDMDMAVAVYFPYLTGPQNYAFLKHFISYLLQCRAIEHGSYLIYTD